LTRILKKELKITSLENGVRECLKAVNNDCIEKKIIKTIFGPPLSSRKLPETGFLMVSLPELDNR
jgi:hypothetical protein